MLLWVEKKEGEEGVCVEQHRSECVYVCVCVTAFILVKLHTPAAPRIEEARAIAA